MMIVKQTLQISAGIFPCLFYHDKPDNDEAGLYVVPNHLAMQLNYRNVEQARFGINCEENSLLTAACLSSNDEFPSFLTIHTLKIVFTSFVNQVPVSSENCIPMTSVLHPNSSTQIFPEALTEKTILEAIKWLGGDCNEVHVTSPNTGMSAYLEAYFKTLLDVIQLLPSNHDDDVAFVNIREFIHEREWPDVGEKNAVLNDIDNYHENDNDEDFWTICCAVRQFLYENLAKQTKIVGHIVDGLHRLTALEIAFTSPNAKKNCTLTATTDVYLPTVTDLNLEFVADMQNLSNTTQNYLGHQKEHGKREIIRLFIQQVETRWKEMSGGNEVYCIDPDHLETQARCIVNVLSDKHLHTTFIGNPNFEKLPLKVSNDTELLYFMGKLFKTHKTEADDPRTGKWTLQFELYKNTPLWSLKKKYANGIYSSKRYNLGDDVDSNLFELAQVLMWTLISNYCSIFVIRTVKTSTDNRAQPTNT